MGEVAKRRGIFLLGALIAVILAIGLVGCGGSGKEEQKSSTESATEEKEQTSEAQELKVTSGFSQEEYGVVGVGVLIENPNTEIAFQNASVQITIKDEDGSVLTTDPGFKVGNMLPGETFGFGLSQYIEEDQTASTVEVSVKGTEKKMTDDNAEAITVGQITDQSGQFSKRFAGELNNSSSDTYRAVMAGVLLKDASGAIVGGGYRDIYDMAPGATSFEVDVYGGAEYTTYEAYGHITSS